MIGQILLQKKLTEVLEASKEKNPSFSLRAFAKKIEMSPSAISEIINGKRKVTRKVVYKIVKNLNLSEIESNELLTLFPEKQTQADIKDIHIQSKQVKIDPTKLIKAKLLLNEFMKTLEQECGSETSSEYKACMILFPEKSDKTEQ